MIFEEKEPGTMLGLADMPDREISPISRIWQRAFTVYEAALMRFDQSGGLGISPCLHPRIRACATMPTRLGEHVYDLRGWTDEFHRGYPARLTKFVWLYAQHASGEPGDRT